MLSLRYAAAFVLWASVAMSGCAHTIGAATGEVVAGATPAVADSTLTVLEDQKLRERVAKVLTTPEIQRSISAITRGVVHGATEQIGEDAPKLAEQLSETLGKTLKTNMAGIGAGTDALTRRAVSAALDEAMSERNQAKSQSFATNLTSALVKTLAAEMSTLSPALRKAIKEDIGPVVGEVVEKQAVDLLSKPEMKTAIAGVVREVARQSVLGTNDGIAELAEKRKAESGSSPLGIFGTFFSERTWLIGGLVAVALLAFPLFWLIRQQRAAKRYREDAERRSNRALALLAAIQTLKPSNEQSREVLSLLRQELGDSDEDSLPPAHQHH